MAITRRDWLVEVFTLGMVITGFRSQRKNRDMENNTCIIDVKVLAHWLIQRFSGEAILAAVKPRFVVALLIANTKSAFPVDSPNVTFTTHRVAFFAIDSITKLFAESDVLGKEYRLMVQQLEVEGKKSYSIRVVEG
jgi:hypothetical protein